MFFDLVCGMGVDENTTIHQSTHKGDIYYFCSSDCKEEFDSDPQFYVDDSQNLI